jgi:hypothetical protein
MLLQASFLIKDAKQSRIEGSHDDDDFIWPVSDSDVTSDGTSAPTGCSVCGYAANNPEDRLDAIKNDILRKLRMLTPPNITNDRYLSDLPLLQQFVDSANNDVQALQQPRFDDDHVTNMTVIGLSQPGKAIISACCNVDRYDS